MTATTRHLLLSGFMGCGKSTVGRRLAQLADAPFVDLDELIETRSGQSIPTMFDAEGEQAFRRWEAETLRDVLDAASPRVVAVGGGALVDATCRQLALQRAFVVTLTASPEIILARTAGSQRPLLRVTSPARTIERLLEVRETAYRACHHSIDTSNLTVEQVARGVLNAWRHAS